jgi:hypothetical protein
MLFGKQLDGKWTTANGYDNRPPRAAVDMSSPLNGGAGYVPLSYSQAHPIVIQPERQITDEELDSQAAFVRLRNTFRQIDDIDNGVLNHRQTIQEAYAGVRQMKEKVHRLEAEFWGKGSRVSSQASHRR